MQVRPATMEDVFHVWSRMWNRGKQELNALGFNAENWTIGWAKRIALNDAVAVSDDGCRADAILGCDWPCTDVCDTHFQATDRFEKPGVGFQITRALRKAIPELMATRGARISVTYSLCIDPDAPKWFRVLGLKEDTEFQGARHGDYVMRRFIRRA